MTLAAHTESSMEDLHVHSGVLGDLEADENLSHLDDSPSIDLVKEKKGVKVESLKTEKSDP